MAADRPAVRTALTDALRTPATGSRARRSPVPRVLGRAIADIARDVIRTQVGDYVRSHGGRIELIDVSDGVVTVDLGGACRGCRAAHDTPAVGFRGRTTSPVPRRRRGPRPRRLT